MIKQLEKRLIELFRKDEPFVASIHGEWGVGKTHFWLDFIKQFENKKNAYISLFGMDSLQEIKSSIAIQVFKINKSISKIKKYFGILSLIPKIGSYIPGFLVSLDLLEKKDFENIIICFDDLERHSTKLAIEDIMGFISDIKEQKNCKIFIILNEEKLKEDEEFIKNKEKIIDYEFNYNPSVEENYKLLKYNDKYFKDYPLEYFKKKNIINIRIMKRVINALDDFSFVEKEISKFSDIGTIENMKKEIALNVISLVAVHSTDFSIDFDELSSYSLFKSNELTNNKTEENPNKKKYEKALDLLNYRIFYIDYIVRIVIDYLKSSMIDEAGLNQIILDKKDIDDMFKIKDFIHNLHQKYMHDFQYKDENFIKDMTKVFTENKDKIIRILEIGHFLYFIKLSCLYENDIFHNLSVEILISDITILLDKKKFKVDPHWSEIIEKIKEYDGKIKEAINLYLEEKKSKNAEKNDTGNLLSIIMKLIKSEGDISEHIDILSSIPSEDYKKHILQDVNFSSTIIDFIKFSKSFQKDDPIKNIADKMLKSFHLILNCDNDLLKAKAKRILSEF
jgi:hypothetical protein